MKVIYNGYIDKLNGVTKNGYPDLTIGKAYDVLKSLYNYEYNLIDDAGDSWWYESDIFLTVDEYREQQIDKVLL